MNVLLISPVAHPVTPDSRYIGIEKEVWEYARELIKEHKVSVIGHSQSVYPEGVNLLGVETPSPFFDLELKAHQSYQYLFRTFDVIHDWSHLHLASRFVPNLPTLNIFFHAPSLAPYPKAPYNIIALSKWAEREFKRIYRQEARYQYSIGIDTTAYKLSQRHRSDRFLTIGRMAPEKGNLDVLRICIETEVPLDIVGGRGFEKTGSDPPTDYEKAIYENCDGKKYRFLGEVSEEKKIKLMQDCRALIYCPPKTHPEVTTHKCFEALLCGAPLIVSNIGSAPEWFTHGIEGYLCNRLDGFKWAMINLDKLNPMENYTANVARLSITNVIKNYIPLYEEVANGLRW